jgi:hypothetical protein
MEEIGQEYGTKKESRSIHSFPQTTLCQPVYEPSVKVKMGGRNGPNVDIRLEHELRLLPFLLLSHSPADWKLLLPVADYLEFMNLDWRRNMLMDWN